MSPLHPTAAARRARPWLALVLFLLGAAVLAVVVVTTGTAAPQPTISVGEQERVRLTAPDGETVVALAVIDTGASRSSIDEDLADDLDLDLDDAPTVTVRSALGRDERPLAEVDVELGGRQRASTVTVADRSELAAPVLIGRSDLDGYQVVVGQERLTTPDQQRRGPVWQQALTRAGASTPVALLSQIPPGLAVVLLLRAALGRRTSAVAPVLLALTFLESGVAVGLSLTLLLLAATAVSARDPHRHHDLVGVIVAAAAAALVVILVLAGDEPTQPAWGAALPLLVGVAVLLERPSGPVALRPWLLACGATVLSSLVVAALLGLPFVQGIAASAPVALAVAGGIWVAAAAVGTGGSTRRELPAT